MEQMAVYTVSYPEKYDNSVAAVLVAAGSSTRMGGISKQMILLEDMPVIAHTILAFQQAQHICEIVLVTRQQDMEAFYSICKQYSFTKVSHIVTGGNTRQQSVTKGICSIDKRAAYFAVHDGARPLINPHTIDGIVQAAYRYGAATAAVRVKDTVKIADDNCFILETPERSRLWNVQTPQIFKRSIFEQALKQAYKNGWDFTDDCQLAEKIGQKVFLYEADYSNIKITTPEDIAFAQNILKERGQC